MAIKSDRTVWAWGKNNTGQLADGGAVAGWAWAFNAMAHDEHANRHFRRRRDQSDRYPAALRHLFNRMLGQLYF